MIMGNKARLLALCLMGVASCAFADGLVKSPKGIYRGTIHTVCMESPIGFADPPNQVFQGDGLRYADTSTSTAIFDGKGTMTESLLGATSFLTGGGFTGALSVGTFVSACRYTISMKADKSFTRQGECSGRLPTGPGAGHNAIVTGIDGEGQVSEDSSVIIVSSSQPDANLLTLTDDFGVTTYSAQRLCVSTGTYLRIGGH